MEDYPLSTRDISEQFLSNPESTKNKLFVKRSEMPTRKLMYRVVGVKDVEGVPYIEFFYWLNKNRNYGTNPTFPINDEHEYREATIDEYDTYSDDTELNDDNNENPKNFYGGYKRKTNKRKTNKRKTKKRKTKKRKTNKRKTNKRKTNKRKTNKRKN
jgi:hypothetical protein